MTTIITDEAGNPDWEYTLEHEYLRKMRPLINSLKSYLDGLAQFLEYKDKYTSNKEIEERDKE